MGIFCLFLFQDDKSATSATNPFVGIGKGWCDRIMRFSLSQLIFFIRRKKRERKKRSIIRKMNSISKVQELCRDFCTRYIACLRGKMQSENLLRSDYPLEHNNNLSNSNSPINTPDQVCKLRVLSPTCLHRSACVYVRFHCDHFSPFSLQESSSAQQSVYYNTTDFLSGSKTNDFSSLQGIQINFRTQRQYELMPLIFSNRISTVTHKQHDCVGSSHIHRWARRAQYEYVFE